MTIDVFRAMEKTHSSSAGGSLAGNDSVLAPAFSIEQD